MNIDEEKGRTESLTGTESFLVGLSPNYWAHVPLFIGDVNNMRLIDGIDCIVTVPSPSPNNVSSKEGSGYTIPITKCLLTGIVVSVNPRYDNSVQYVLDDGTGMIDCLKWGPDEEYILPSLTDINNTKQQHPQYKIGDLVQIWGKIRIAQVVHDNDDEGSIGSACIREIHITCMEAASSKTTVKHNFDTSWQIESRHMKRVYDYWNEKLQWNEEEPSTVVDCNNNSTQENASSTNTHHRHHRNAIDVLSVLGPTVSQQVLDQMEWPSPNEKDAVKWRIFGPSCQCILSRCNLKEELLYCPCRATVEPMDPDWKFREELLCYLLKQERNLADPKEALIFEYQSIIEDNTLRDNIMNANDDNDSVSYPVLLQKIVTALRKDKILFLIDSSSDTYLLVTRSRVLEPMLLTKRSGTKKVKRNNLLSLYERLWQFVPKVRLQYIQHDWKLQQRE